MNSIFFSFGACVFMQAYVRKCSCLQMPEEGAMSPLGWNCKHMLAIQNRYWGPNLGPLECKKHPSPQVLGLINNVRYGSIF